LKEQHENEGDTITQEDAAKMMNVSHRAVGQPAPLALVEELAEKLFELHPEAAADDAVFDPFWQTNKEKSLNALLHSTEDVVRSFVNLTRVLRGQELLPQRRNVESWDAPTWPPRD
jgi:hypothetical protein